MNRRMLKSTAGFLRVTILAWSILGWILVWIGPENFPVPLVALGAMTAYTLIHLALIYRTLRRIHHGEFSSESWVEWILGCAVDALVALTLWVNGKSLQQVRATGTQILQERRAREERKKKLFERARAIGCEGEIHRTRNRHGIVVAEVLLRRRQAEFNTKQARLAALRSTIESRGWNEVAKAALESKDLDELERIVRDLSVLTGQASRLGILDIVDGFLREGKVGEARLVALNEQIASDRSRALEGLKGRISALRPHPSCADLERQHTDLVKASRQTTDREFRKALHPLETDIQKVERIVIQRKKA